MYPLKNGSHNALALAEVNGSSNWNRLNASSRVLFGKSACREAGRFFYGVMGSMRDERDTGFQNESTTGKSYYTPALATFAKLLCLLRQKDHNGSFIKKNELF